MQLGLALATLAASLLAGCSGAGPADEATASEGQAATDASSAWSCTTHDGHKKFSVRYSAHPGTNQVWVDLHGANKDKSNVEMLISRPHMGWTESLYAYSLDNVARGRHRVRWDPLWGPPVLKRGDSVFIAVQFADSGGDPMCLTKWVKVT